VGKKRHRRKEDSGDTATAGAGGRSGVFQWRGREGLFSAVSRRDALGRHGLCGPHHFPLLRAPKCNIYIQMLHY
jgi:hypothetical protein